MNICPTGGYETSRIMPCDGTATSERWCCGDSDDCCTTNDGVVTLKQVFAGVTSSVVSSTALTSPTSAQAPETVTSIGTSATMPRSRDLAGGVIAGIVVGVIFGLALFLAIFLHFRRRSRERKVDGLLIAEASGMSQRHELSPSTENIRVQELPGPPPGELLGDVPGMHSQSVRS